MRMNQRKEITGKQNYKFAVIFLFSIFIHTELSAMFMGISLRRMFLIISALCCFLYINVRSYLPLYICIIGSFLVILLGNFLVPENYTDSRMIYSLLTYCIPFMFANAFCNDFTERSVKLGFLVALLLLGLWAFAGWFRRWNSNCIAYLYFGGINFYLVIPMHFQKQRHFRLSDSVYLCLYIFGIVLLFQTDSRNVMLAQVAVWGMLFFRKIIENKLIFRLLSWFAIAYSAISIAINEIILNNEKLFNFFLKISYELSGKYTVFDGRINLQRVTLEAIRMHPMLGYSHMPNSDGIATHNNYLQLRYEVGLIGIILCAIFLHIVLKRAYESFTMDKEDGVSYVFAAIIVGFLIQMGAESFLFGNDIIVLMPYFFMGVLLYRNRRMKFETREKQAPPKRVEQQRPLKSGRFEGYSSKSEAKWYWVMNPKTVIDPGLVDLQSTAVLPKNLKGHHNPPPTLLGEARQ